MSEKDSLSIRYIRQYDIKMDQQPSRLDVTLVQLRPRPHWLRLIRLPLHALRLHRAGLTWQIALRFAWFYVWLKPRV